MPGTAIALRFRLLRNDCLSRVSYVACAYDGNHPFRLRVVLARWTKSPTDVTSYAVSFFCSLPDKGKRLFCGNRQGARTHTALFNFLYTKIEGKKCLPSKNGLIFEYSKIEGTKNTTFEKNFFNTLDFERIFIATF